MIAVVVNSSRLDRIAEALRAALGLGLRGERVRVLITERSRADCDGADPRIARALATLRALGQEVSVATEQSLASSVRAARAVEVWT